MEQFDGYFKKELIITEAIGNLQIRGPKQNEITFTEPKTIYDFQLHMKSMEDMIYDVNGIVSSLSSSQGFKLSFNTDIDNLGYYVSKVNFFTINPMTIASGFARGNYRLVYRKCEEFKGFAFGIFPTYDKWTEWYMERYDIGINKLGQGKLKWNLIPVDEVFREGTFANKFMKKALNYLNGESLEELRKQIKNVSAPMYEIHISQGPTNN